MSPSGETTLGTNGGVRKEDRSILGEQVELTNLSHYWSPETTATHNISLRGARVITRRLWEPGSLLMLKSVRGNFWARARVVYWRSFFSRAAIGLEFVAYGGDWPSPAN